MTVIAYYLITCAILSIPLVHMMEVGLGPRFSPIEWSNLTNLTDSINNGCSQWNTSEEDETLCGTNRSISAKGSRLHFEHQGWQPESRSMPFFSFPLMWPSASGIGAYVACWVACDIAGLFPWFIRWPMKLALYSHFWVLGSIGTGFVWPSLAAGLSSSTCLCFPS